MQYIISQDKEGIQFGDYMAALELYRHKLPQEVLEFASDERRFSLNHPSSLHDAWVEQITISKSRSTDELASEISITVTLLGQMHDRRIVLTYIGVSSYTIEAGENQYSTQNTLHGDIFTHEVRPSDKNEVIHEIAIGSGGRLEVCCKTLNAEDHIEKAE